MVKIRLRRMGAKKAPYYRVVVADSRYPPLRSRSTLTGPVSGSRPVLSPLRPFVLC